ncbi:hypothetical protein [Morganella morganii]|uniref:hypothetical protein n=1 Tax=Morganella morganii TaxID=582 RepID=UPI00187C211A|nr:hypothetical protein [Morganella morganii]
MKVSASAYWLDKIRLLHVFCPFSSISEIILDIIHVQHDRVAEFAAILSSNGSFADLADSE